MRDWFEMWCESKENIIETMYRNMESDLKAGYSPHGELIQKQKEALEKYEREYETQLMNFAEMTTQKVNKWCFLDLKRKGYIE